MYSYNKIIERQNELIEKNEQLHIDRINLVAPLYNLRGKYPEMFNVLPNNFNGVDPFEFAILLELLTYRVENSNIEYIEKKQVAELVNNIKKQLQVINNKQRMYDKFLTESIGPEKLKRENYLEGIHNETEIIERQIEQLEKDIEEYKINYQKVIEKGWEKEILEGFEAVITRKQNEINELKNRKREIFSEEGLKEEIELYNKEKSKIEKEILKVQEKETQDALKEEKQKHSESIKNKSPEPKIINEETSINLGTGEKNDNSVEKNNDANLQNDVDFVLVNDEEQQKPVEPINVSEEKMVNNENKSQNKKETALAVVTPEINQQKTDEEKIEPIKPEKPKKVKSKHKASPELIKKIKKYGAVGLGIASIGIAITTLILNPAIAGWALGAGLIFSEAKESLVKK